MNKVLGNDCNGKEIYEYSILIAELSNDIDIEDLKNADPRHYCALVAEDGKAYAISVYDWWNNELIRERENLKRDQEIPVIIKPISEMKKYECALKNDDKEFYYDSDDKELKHQLNKIIKSRKN